jgi:hypothetical protein
VPRSGKNVRGVWLSDRVFESAADLDRLQALLDSSLAGATEHLRSIVRPGERALTARQVVEVCRSMCTLAVATVTRGGEPRISAVDGHLLGGRWVIGTHPRAAKARHLASRPAISATYLRGEQVGIFTHGRAVPLNPHGGPEDPAWPDVRRYLLEHYGDDGTWDWDQVIYYRIDPTWMVGYSDDPSALGI